MRRFSSVAVLGLVAALACMGDGLPPRPSSSDYPVHRQTASATLAAVLLPPETVKKLFPAEVYKNYVVVEVAVYPSAAKTAYVDSFDFSLKFGAGDVSHPRTPEEIVQTWVEKNAPQPPGKVDVTTETGVVYASGNDPVYGRTHGWATYTGVGVSPGQPTPPRPLSTDPRVFEDSLRTRALPDGPALKPIAGYLYFPILSKKSKSGSMELEHFKDSVSTRLPFPAK